MVSDFLMTRPRLNHRDPQQIPGFVTLGDAEIFRGGPLGRRLDKIRCHEAMIRRYGNHLFSREAGRAVFVATPVAERMFREVRTPFWLMWASGILDVIGSGRVCKCLISRITGSVRSTRTVQIQPPRERRKYTMSPLTVSSRLCCVPG